jgi:hypothetical protein
MKRNADSAGLDMMQGGGGGEPCSSEDDDGSSLDVKPPLHHGEGRGGKSKGGDRGEVPCGKKTKGRVKIKMEYIDNKLRRYTTFSKRKTGIMKKVRKR